MHICTSGVRLPFAIGKNIPINARNISVSKYLPEFRIWMWILLTLDLRIFSRAIVIQNGCYSLKCFPLGSLLLEKTLMFYNNLLNYFQEWGASLDSLTYLYSSLGEKLSFEHDLGYICSHKIQRKKIIKKNDFFIFDCPMKNIKENQI